MTDSPTSPGGGVRPTHSAATGYPGTPRWVKVFGVAAVAVILLFAGLHLTGHGLGPGSHAAHVSGR